MQATAAWASFGLKSLFARLHTLSPEPSPHDERIAPQSPAVPFESAHAPPLVVVAAPSVAELAELVAPPDPLVPVFLSSIFRMQAPVAIEPAKKRNLALSICIEALRRR